MKKYNYEVEVFVSRKLGFGFILETNQLTDGSYRVKLSRFNPETSVTNRVSYLKPTINGLSFSECCERIKEFREIYA